MLKPLTLLLLLTTTGAKAQGCKILLLQIFYNTLTCHLRVL